MAFVKVNADECIACGACYAEFPEIFTEDAEGKAVSNFETTECTLDLDGVAETCPVEAISIEG